MTQEEIGKLPFEKALAELEKLVSNMESGQMPLAELIGAYEQGAKLAAHCRTQLNSLQRRIELIVNGNDPKAEQAESVEFAPGANEGDRGGSGDVPF